MIKGVTILIATGLFLLGVGFAPQVASQTEETFNFERAYSDYIFTSEVYSKAHSDYLLARAQYLQAETLAAQAKAREATIAMLQARDDVLITYLTALRMRLLEGRGVSEVDREGLFSRVDAEVTWIKGHRERVGSAGTLEDLVDDSEEMHNRFTAITEGLSYEVLSAIPTGVVRDVRNKLTGVLTKSKTKIGSIRANGDHDTETAERWVTETENKVTRSLDKEIEAQSLAFTLQSSDTKNKATVYNNVAFRLQESLQFLKDASKFLREVIREIKTKN